MSKATITPGVQMVTKGAQCTGNFVFTDARDRVYVGYAAHCAGRGEATDTNGCQTRSVALGTPVTFVKGMSVATPGTTVGRGTLAYSSWIDMRRRGLNGGPACDYNDFALVRVASGVGASTSTRRCRSGAAPAGSARARSRPAAGSTPTATPGCAAAPSRWPPRPVPRSAGPAGAGRTTPTPSPRASRATPARGFLDAQGRAFGVLSTVAVAPLPASNGLGDLYREVRYAQKHSGIAGLRLVAGTKAFDPVL